MIVISICDILLTFHALRNSLLLSNIWNPDANYVQDNMEIRNVVSDQLRHVG